MTQDQSKEVRSRIQAARSKVDERTSELRLKLFHLETEILNTQSPFTIKILERKKKWIEDLILVNESVYEQLSTLECSFIS